MIEAKDRFVPGKSPEIATCVRGQGGEPKQLSVRPFTPHTSSFTLVEVLVAMAILALMLVILGSVMASATTLWQKTSVKAQEFRDTRLALGSLQRTLGQATLNTYFDYLDAGGNARTNYNNYVAGGSTTNSSSYNTNFVANSYGRISYLRFLTGPVSTVPVTPPDGGTAVTQAAFFQAPTGDVNNGDSTVPYLRPMNSLLNTYGFFLEVNSDASAKPNFPGIIARTRFRLMEMVEPAENLTVYSLTSGNPNYTNFDWYTTPLGRASYVTPVAENIVAMIFTVQYPDPTGALQNSYLYGSCSSTNSPAITIFSNTVTSTNTRHLLPPIVNVTLVAIDEPSAARLASAYPSASAQITALGLGGTALFTTPTSYASDLATLESTLTSKNCGYRVFTSSVAIEGAKWSIH